LVLLLFFFLRIVLSLGFLVLLGLPVIFYVCFLEPDNTAVPEVVRELLEVELAEFDLDYLLALLTFLLLHFELRVQVEPLELVWNVKSKFDFVYTHVLEDGLLEFLERGLFGLELEEELPPVLVSSLLRVAPGQQQNHSLCVQLFIKVEDLCNKRLVGSDLGLLEGVLVVPVNLSEVHVLLLGAQAETLNRHVLRVAHLGELQNHLLHFAHREILRHLDFVQKR